MEKNKENDAAESYFGVDELFISKTNKLGVIESGNDVFVRVSGYSRNQLLGSPHNIIRHPDMPKAVFRLLWSTIASGRSICAYVKNRSVDGKFYWVLAAVTPVENGYLSIRIKPTSPILEKVKEVYALVKRDEAKLGIEKSLEQLSGELVKLGFDSYETFMRKALVAEVGARDEALRAAKMSGHISVESQAEIQNLNDANTIRVLKLIHSRCASGAKSFAESFSKLERFSDVKNEFENHTEVILKSCRRLEYISLNMSVTANKLGKEGIALSVVSSAFQRAAKDIVERFEAFGKAITTVSGLVADNQLGLGFGRLQVEMLEFFTAEAIASIASFGEIENSQRSHELLADTRMITDLARDYFVSVSKIWVAAF